ncbi:MAG: DUF368 domain-containing protein [Pirellulales bacterium]|nr:DUF368 domain-containing protein [Pirellulales bacterium]
MIRPTRNDVAQIIRGFLMGAADIIPGVSGGTVSLVLGIYQRLVRAISRVDVHLLRMLANRDLRSAAGYLDLRFLVALGLGIVTGIGCLAGLMGKLLLEQRAYTLAIFSGLILGSSVVVAKMVQPRGARQWIGCLSLAVVAAGIAYWLAGQQQVGFHDSYGYFFFCGAIAICAMILPGVSGAYILWLLGAYVVVTSIIQSALKLQATQREWISLFVFAAGCAVGLIGFSKILKWLLEKAHKIVMAILGGFMVGSVRLMWPFQQDLTPYEEQLKAKRFDRYLPESWDQEVTVCLLLAVGAILFVLLLDRASRRA